MLPNLLIEQVYQTPLGVVTCGLSSLEPAVEMVEQKRYDNGESYAYKTLTHSIEVITFKRRLPLFNGNSVKGTMGWIWRIIKELDRAESLQISCLLMETNPEVKLLGADCGEHLDAAWMHDDDWNLHIGTEDGEVMQTRALNDDWMPLRFKDELGFSNSFTTIQPNGVVTKVPELKQGEKVHLQYLTAYDKYEEDKLNTWFAVDEFKRNIENLVGVW